VKQRVDQHVADRTVLPSEPRLVLQQRLTAGEPGEHVFDDGSIDVKLGDVVADVLVACVAEEIQFGLVCPQDRAVRADPMEPFGGVVQALFQFLVDAGGDLLLEGVGAVRGLGVLRAGFCHRRFPARCAASRYCRKATGSSSMHGADSAMSPAFIAHAAGAAEEGFDCGVDRFDDTEPDGVVTVSADRSM
jgi:hypothetical protein